MGIQGSEPMGERSLSTDEPGLIARILPPEAVAVDTRRELIEVELFPQELAVVENAVRKRRDEFVTARACARVALERLNVPLQPILSGERGDPQWPAGVVGSITHCRGYRACALARSGAIASLGIDAESNEPLPDGVLDAIAHGREAEWVGRRLRSRPEVRWDRLLFSAKESVYKAWYPLAQRWLGFEDALILPTGDDGFSVELLVDGPRLAGREVRGFTGRWIAIDGLVLSAIVVPAPEG